MYKPMVYVVGLIKLLGVWKNQYLCDLSWHWKKSSI